MRAVIRPARLASLAVLLRPTWTEPAAFGEIQPIGPDSAKDKLGPFLTHDSIPRPRAQLNYRRGGAPLCNSRQALAGASKDLILFGSRSIANSRALAGASGTDRRCSQSRSVVSGR